MVRHLGDKPFIAVSLAFVGGIRVRGLRKMRTNQRNYEFVEFGKAEIVRTSAARARIRLVTLVASIELESRKRKSSSSTRRPSVKLLNNSRFRGVKLKLAKTAHRAQLSQFKSVFLRQFWLFASICEQSENKIRTICA